MILIRHKEKNFGFLFNNLFRSRLGMARDIAKYTSYDEQDYKKRRWKYFLKGIILPKWYLSSKLNKVEKMRDSGMSTEEIRNSI